MHLRFRGSLIPSHLFDLNLSIVCCVRSDVIFFVLFFCSNLKRCIVKESLYWNSEYLLSFWLNFPFDHSIFQLQFIMSFLSTKNVCRCISLYRGGCLFGCIGFGCGMVAAIASIRNGEYAYAIAFSMYYMLPTPSNIQYPASQFYSFIFNIFFLNILQLRLRLVSVYLGKALKR